MMKKQSVTSWAGLSSAYLSAKVTLTIPEVRHDHNTEKYIRALL